MTECFVFLAVLIHRALLYTWTGEWILVSTIRVSKWFWRRPWVARHRLHRLWPWCRESHTVWRPFLNLKMCQWQFHHKMWWTHYLRNLMYIKSWLTCWPFPVCLTFLYGWNKTRYTFDANKHPNATVALMFKHIHILTIWIWKKTMNLKHNVHKKYSLKIKEVCKRDSVQLQGYKSFEKS